MRPACFHLAYAQQYQRLHEALVDYPGTFKGGQAEAYASLMDILDNTQLTQDADGGARKCWDTCGVSQHFLPWRVRRSWWSWMATRLLYR